MRRVVGSTRVGSRIDNFDNSKDSYNDRCGVSDSKGTGTLSGDEDLSNMLFGIYKAYAIERTGLVDDEDDDDERTSMLDASIDLDDDDEEGTSVLGNDYYSRLENEEYAELDAYANFNGDTSFTDTLDNPRISIDISDGDKAQITKVFDEDVGDYFDDLFMKSADYLRVAHEIDIALRVEDIIELSSIYGDEFTSVYEEDTFDFATEDVDMDISREYSRNLELDMPEVPRKTPPRVGNAPTGRGNSSRKFNSEYIWQFIYRYKKVLFLLIVAVVGYFGWCRITDKVAYIKDYRKLESAVANLYTNKNKEEIKSGVTSNRIDVYLTSLEDMPDVWDKKGQEELYNELITVSKYLEDRVKVNTILGSSYDLNNPDTSSDLDSIEESLRSYTVVGLTLTMSSKVERARSNLNTYNELKNEVMGITDYTVVDYNSYSKRIGSITNRVNREELEDVVSNMKKQSDAIKQNNQDKLEKLQEDLNKAKDNLNQYVERKSFVEGVQEAWKGIVNSFGGNKDGIDDTEGSAFTLDGLLDTIKDGIDKVSEGLGSLF